LKRIASTTCGVLMSARTPEMHGTAGEDTPNLQTASTPFRVKVRVQKIAVNYAMDSDDCEWMTPEGARYCARAGYIPAARALRNLGLEVT
jgi:hypothetical protein